jgi:hypothetical protein
MSEQKHDLDLTALVTAIRDELEGIDKKRRDDRRPALLQLTEMELELHFSVQTKIGGQGKVELKVIPFINASIGADGGLQRENIQKIKLKFLLADQDKSDDLYPLGARLHSTSTKETSKQVTDSDETIVPI